MVTCNVIRNKCNISNLGWQKEGRRKKGRGSDGGILDKMDRALIIGHTKE